VASVVATVRSKVPSETELAKARDVLFVPYNPEGDEIRVEKWLKKKGDAALAGEPVLEYTVGRNRDVKVLPAPYDLTLGDIFVEYWDNAEVGQTLGIVVPAVK
jgi:pyruvate/2-oxoglutarate dehydrogenase complex dihydrolipoamide acyltransferase (E2) component